MQKKSKIKDEKGSMAVYATVVLMTILVIITTLYSYTSLNRKSQLKTVLKIKQAYEETVDLIQNVIESGITPLFLANSKSLTLTDYKIYGNSVQQVLPDDYVQVEYIESTGEEYIDTGLNLTNEDKIEVEYMVTNTNNYVVFGARNSANSKNIGAGMIDDYHYADFNNSAYATYRAGYTGSITNTKLKYVLSKEGRYLYNGQTEVMSNTTLCEDVFTTDQTCYIFYGNGTQTTKADKLTGRIYSFKIYRNNILIQDMIPCYREADNVVGMYDIVNGTFHTNEGSGSFRTGSTAPTPDAPIEIQSVGELVTDTADENYGKYKIPVTVRGENLFDKDNYNVLYTAMSATALGTSAPNTYRTVYIQVEPNTTYTIQKQMDGVKNRFSVACFDEEPNYGSTVNECLGGNNLNEVTITTTSTTRYLAIYLWITGAELTPDETINSLIIEKGDKITLNEYNIYLNEPLRKVGDKADYIDFENKKIVRCIEHIELTGNEQWNIQWQKDNTFSYLIEGIYEETSYTEKFKGYCNYFPRMTHGEIYSDDPLVNGITNVVDAPRIAIRDITCTSLAEFKQKLSDRYNNGNPVIVEYLLKTPVEETIELPTISIKEGNCIIDIDTNVKPTIEVTYKKMIGN